MKAVKCKKIDTCFGGLEVISGIFENCRFSRHVHETYGLGVIRSGILKFNYRGEMLAAGSGQISSVNPDEPHDGHSPDNGGWAYTMLYFDDKFFKNAFADMNGAPALPFISNGVFTDCRLANVFDRYAGDVLGNFNETLTSDNLLCDIFSLLLAQHTDKVLHEKRTYGMGSRLKSVKDFINSRPDGNISVKELADIAGLSKYHFIRSFKKDTGLAPYEYVIAVKAGYAKKLLLNGMSQAAAAAQAGYADQSHMIRRFKQVYGFNPSVFSNIVQ